MRKGKNENQGGNEGAERCRGAIGRIERIEALKRC